MKGAEEKLVCEVCVRIPAFLLYCHSIWRKLPMAAAFAMSCNVHFNRVYKYPPSRPMICPVR